jgi:hypothetical protein
LDFEVCGFGFLFARGLFYHLNQKEKAATHPKITDFLKRRVAAPESLDTK